MMITFLALGQDTTLSTSVDSKDFSFLFAEEDSNLLAFLQQYHLLDGITWSALLPADSSFQEIVHHFDEEATAFTKIKHSRTRINLGSYYTNLDTSTTLSVPTQWFSYFDLRQSIDLGRLPFQIGGLATFQDARLERNLSNLTISFDSKAYIINEKERLLSAITPDKLLTNAVAVSQFSPTELTMLRKQLKQKLLLHILRSDAYIDIRQQLEQKLQTVTDTLNLLDSTQYHVVKTALDKVRKVPQQYQALWQDSTLRNLQQQRIVQAKLYQLNSHLQIIQDPNTLRQWLKNETDLSFFEQALLFTSGLQIGLVDLNGGPFTVRHAILKGLEYAWQTNNTYGNIAIGKQGLQQNPGLFPILQQGFFRSFIGRNMQYASVGVGRRGYQHLNLEFLRITEGTAVNDTISTIPKENRVIGINSSIAVTKATNIDLSCSLSDYTLKNTTTSNEPESSFNTIDNVAFEGQIKHQFGFLGSKIGIGYFQIGTNFTSIANPFLLTNRSGTLVSFTTQSNPRVDLELRWGHSLVVEEQFPGDTEDWQMVGNLVWNYGQGHSLIIGASPNTYRQNGNGAFNLSTSNFLYYIQSIWQYQLGKREMLSQIGYANFRSDFQLMDTITLTQAAYLTGQQLVQLSERSAVEANFQFESNEEWGNGIGNVLMQLSYQFHPKGVQLQFGGQLLKIRTDKEWRYGITGLCMIPLHQQIHFTANWQAQRTFAKSLINSSWQIYFQTGVQLNL